MMHIDFNADLAEGCGNDQALLQLVSSANICCGIHAGNAVEMHNALQQAKLNHVRIGAHPSFPDREHFGRMAMDLPDHELQAHLIYQLGAIQALCQQAGVHLAYVKPHGALYNQSAQNPKLARLIAQTVKDFNPQLKIMGLANSHSLKEAQALGLGVISEVFADRRYLADGTLVPRTHEKAKIEHDDEAIEQVLNMVEHGKVHSIDGKEITVQADSVCLHGDGEHTLIFANKIRTALLERGIHIRADISKHSE